MKDINSDLVSSEATVHIVPMVGNPNQYIALYAINGTPIQQEPLLSIKNAGEKAHFFIQTIIDKLNKGTSLETILSELK